VIVGVEYFEMIRKAITARSLGTFSPTLLGFNDGYRKKLIYGKTASMALSSSNFPIIISQVSTSSF
jgi:hypothetical protein